MSKIQNSLPTLTIFCGLMLSNFCLGQGASYGFYNLAAGLDAPVFDAQGNRLAGTNYLAILYGGPTIDSLQLARDDSSSVAMPPVPFTYMPLGEAGYFRYARYVTIQTVPCGGTPWLQVRAWDVRLGATYEEVVSLDIGGYGESNLFQKQGGFDCGLPSPPELLYGLQSFALREVIPEPGSMLLLLLGLPALLFFRRHRSP